MLIDRADDATADWFTTVLRSAGAICPPDRVVSAVGHPLGTGQRGDSIRFS